MFTAQIDRTFDIDLATMWALWTDPAHAARWFRPSLEEFGPTVADIDLRLGGLYRIEMVRADGTALAMTGRVVEFEEPTRLVYTWQWDGTDDESLVEILLDKTDAGTKVTINHTKLASQEDADRHTEGWVGCLESMARTY